MGQSKIEVFRRILGDEAAAQQGQRGVRGPLRRGRSRRGDLGRARRGRGDTIMRLARRGRAGLPGHRLLPVTRDAIIDRARLGRLIDLALSPADAGRGRHRGPTCR